MFSNNKLKYGKKQMGIFEMIKCKSFYDEAWKTMHQSYRINQLIFDYIYVSLKYKLIQQRKYT